MEAQDGTIQAERANSGHERTVHPLVSPIRRIDIMESSQRSVSPVGTVTRRRPLGSTTKPKLSIDAESARGLPPARPRGAAGPFMSLRPETRPDRVPSVLDWPNARLFRVLSMSKCWMDTPDFVEVCSSLRITVFLLGLFTCY